MPPSATKPAAASPTRTELLRLTALFPRPTPLKRDRGLVRGEIDVLDKLGAQRLGVMHGETVCVLGGAALEKSE
jgi:hypothetical protein